MRSQFNSLKTILLSAGAITLLIFVGLAFQVHSILNQDQTTQAKIDQQHTIHIGILTSDSIHDQSWGSLAYEGQGRLLEEDFPVKVDLISEVNTESKMKHETTQLIERGIKLVIGHGREFSPVFTELAQSYQDVRFVTINGQSKHPNQTVLTLNYYSYNYFVGIIAALMTKTNKVGMIEAYGIDNEVIENFKLAVNKFNPDAEMFFEVVGSRDDEITGGKIARELIEQGVDVIFTQGNAYNRSVIHEAEKADIYVIGYITDQAYMAKQHVITSVVNHVPEAYVYILESYLSEEGIQSGNIVLDFKDGVYSFAPFGPMVPEEIQRVVIDELERYNQGEVIIK